MNFVDLENLLTCNFCCVCSIQHYYFSLESIDMNTSLSDSDESILLESST